MSELVSYRLEGDIGVIAIDYPPVNALSHGVRKGLQQCLREGLADDAAQALIVIGAGRTFPAGADIREFGKPPEDPWLPEVIDGYDASSKLVVAAIHGTALGGGLEVALGCHYRVALDSAKVGLPEVKLGLLPGAGGTQRLPRLVGAQAALEMIVSGTPVDAAKGRELGILDEVVEGDLLQGALAYARRLVAENAPLRQASAGSVTADAGLFSNFEQSIARKSRGFLAPFHCIKAVQAAAELPFEAGCKRERALFMELMQSPESAAQRHVFFAERAVAKVPVLDPKTPKREINTVGILGAGTMGGGIAMNFLNAGMAVTLLEVQQEALDQGVALIRKNYEATAKKGRVTQERVEQCMALLTPTLRYDDLASVDLVIEAVFENMGVKKEVFGQLDAVCKPSAILATNTSTLDINEIAAATRRPEDVMGMHFFSPANVMRLLENVRGEKTADQVLVTVMDLAKRIGKVGVLVGVCRGFVGNRILHQRRTEATALVNEGATPEQVDRVLFDFGFPMGEFAMSDLAGLDVGYRIRQGQREADPDNGPQANWLDALAEAGRYGQKTRAGVYDYAEGSRTPIPSEVTARLIDEYRREKGIQPRTVSDQEVLERCLYVMVNEGAKILEQGIANRPLDVDVIWIYGYGFPVYRGGPLFWADHIGLQTIHDKIAEFHRDTGKDHWQPAKLLERLASEGKGFYGQG
ncbi:MAG: 3-hydroxyacyl-CoA dehydrogenase NAD-binding domain-containing protein [Salinisphaera sp.]|nr:3-hydroxyacyl-CoA dehydrogenase NAD-binding domain-containing protein [Salinisphaera sp.]